MKNYVTKAIALAFMLQGGSVILPSFAQAQQPTTQQNASPSAHLAVLNALHRFTWGMDSDSVELVRSAFTSHGVADFSPAAPKIGITFPPLAGRDTIGAGLSNFAAGLTTSHSVTNTVVQVSGNTARLQALVEAQHIPASDPTRHYLMKNRYDVTLVRQGRVWLITRMTINNIWSDGDVKVISGG